MSLAQEARVKGKLGNGQVKSATLYRRWCVMRRRCYDSNFIAYPHYGARGITVCEEWRTDYPAFQRWALSNGWEEGLTLDRIDPRGNYTPDNCRWVSLAEQQRNRNGWCIYVKSGGVRLTVGELADLNGVARSLAYARIKRFGWDPERAATTPSSHNGKSLVTVDGRSQTMYAWAKELGVKRSHLYQLLKQGRDPIDLVRTLKEKHRNGI